jgi:WD40 repeat protein
MVPDKDVFGIVRFWDRDTGRVRLSKYGSKSISDIALSPDGRIFAWATAVGFVKIMDSGRGTCLKRLPAHRSSVCPVAFSSDGVLLFARTGNGIAAWDMATWSVSEVRPPTNVYCLATSPLDSTVAGGTIDGAIHLWHIGSLPHTISVAGHLGTVLRVRFSDDGRMLASTGEDRTVRVWNRANDMTYRILEPPRGAIQAPGESRATVYAVAFVPRTGLLATGDESGWIRVWDSASGAVMAQVHSPNYVTALAVTRDGRTLASGHGNGRICLWALDL